MFIFDRCRRNSAAVATVKYECDWNNLTDAFTRSKILLTEKLTNGPLVTPHPRGTRLNEISGHAGSKQTKYHWASDRINCQWSTEIKPDSSVSTVRPCLTPFSTVLVPLQHAGADTRDHWPGIGPGEHLPPTSFHLVWGYSGNSFLLFVTFPPFAVL